MHAASGEPVADAFNKARNLVSWEKVRYAGRMPAYRIGKR